MHPKATQSCANAARKGAAAAQRSPKAENCRRSARTAARVTQQRLKHFLHVLVSIGTEEMLVRRLSSEHFAEPLHRELRVRVLLLPGSRVRALFAS